MKMGEILRSELSLLNPDIVLDIRGKGLLTGITIKDMKGWWVPRIKKKTVMFELQTGQGLSTYVIVKSHRNKCVGGLHAFTR